MPTALMSGPYDLVSLVSRFERIDLETGFLCASEPPIHHLEDPYYSPWEDTIRLLPDLLMSGQVRKFIDSMPVLEVKPDLSRPELERACDILAFMGHAYVRGGNQQPITADTLPAQIGKPWKRISEILGINPIACFATTVLYNWALIDPAGPISLDNVRCLATCTGSPDESWFYLNILPMEAQGGALLRLIVDLLNAIQADEPEACARALWGIKGLLDQFVPILERMYEWNLPSVFYKRVRPYLAGWTNDTALPNGVVYEAGQPGEFYSGASVAQSALFQAIDLALGIYHQPKQNESMGTRVGPPGTYLRAMHSYMPRGHRQFLEWLQETLHVRPYVLDRLNRAPLKEAYNAALTSLETFRSAHIKMVSYYVISQASLENEMAQGTGGSNPIPFLKALRAHVTAAKLP